MLREVVLGIYFDLPFAVQASPGILQNTMKGIQNAINESWKTKKDLTAWAVTGVLNRKKNPRF
jgi:uracil DNA glycosylase